MEKFNSKDPLVSFLYILLRDYLPAGDVEEIMLKHVKDQLDNPESVTVFTNGYLAQYAAELALRLKGQN